MGRSDEGAAVQNKVDGADNANGSEKEPFRSSLESSAALVKTSAKTFKVF